MMTVTYDLDTWREGDQVFSAMAKCVGGAYVLAEDYEALQSELAERQENLNVQDNVIDGLREEIAALKSAPLFDALANKQEARIAALEKAAVRLYNLGYHSGHEDTVEGCYTHIYEADMDEYHDDIVADILREAGYLGGGE